MVTIPHKAWPRRVDLLIAKILIFLSLLYLLGIFLLIALAFIRFMSYLAFP